MVFLALLDGTVTAFVLALIALGLSLVFGVMRIVNVAHGEFFMLGAVLSWFAYHWTADSVWGFVLGQTMTLERITFEDAMQLLSLPRVVGVDPTDGMEITVQNGRFGPYLRKGSDSRSLESEEQLLTITLDGCLAVLAQPKRRGRTVARPPLRELGVDPASGRTMILKDGNWGPYVTDGEHNASLKRGDSVEELTDERAAELLAERRMKGPPRKRR